MAKLPRPNFRRRRASAPAPADPQAAEAAAEEQPAASAAEPAPPQADPAAAPTTPLPPIPPISPTGEQPPAAPPESSGGSRLTPPSLWPDWSRRLIAALGLIGLAGLGFGIGYLVADDSDDSVVSPAPAVIVESSPQPEATEEIGFPEFATRNTTRVGGADAIANGAGVALASYPTLGGVGGPDAVILAPGSSWQGALAATPLTADPLAAPLLLSEQRELPELTAEALAGLAPQGIDDAEGVQAIAIGDVAVPEDLETLRIGEDGDDVAELAKDIDAERARLTGEKEPDNLLVVSSEKADMAMPAAAWAARSGDPILFAAGDDVPEATLEVIAKYKRTPIYVLGDEGTISGDALKAMEDEGAAVTRISNESDPVESSIEFARFADGEFGWNINDPGHGFVIARTDRPLDAAVGAPLSAGGKPGPLLVTDDGGTVPAALQGFLSDTQPGFIDDPSRAVYNHVWLLGNTEALSVAFQAQIDELTKLAPVTTETSGPEFGPDPSGPEDEPDPSGAGVDAEDEAKAGKDGGGDTRDDG
jgi:hypothetical protein